MARRPDRQPVSRRITGGEYDKKARERKERQTELAMRIEQHANGEGKFRTTLESLISLASRPAEPFERSKVDHKRQSLAFVFSNLRLRGEKLEFSMRSPFDLMVDRASMKVGWGTRMLTTAADNRRFPRDFWRPRLRCGSIVRAFVGVRQGQ